MSVSVSAKLVVRSPHDEATLYSFSSVSSCRLDVCPATPDLLSGNMTAAVKATTWTERR